MIDYECTFFPERVPDWLGGLLTPCCVAHDLGGADWALWQCVAILAPGAFLTASVMWLGVVSFRPLWRWAKTRGT